jgi:hypothetical protein
MIARWCVPHRADCPHGNSLPRLVKLDGLPDEKIVDLKYPPQVPPVYQLSGRSEADQSFYLGDPEAVGAMQAVANQSRKD